MSGVNTLPPIPPNIAMLTGPTMVGICLNWGFMGVLVVQVYYYHITFPNDTKLLKSLVYGLFLLDIAQTAMVTADAFHWFVFGYGNMARLDDTFLNSWDVCLLDAVISLIVQCFYCWRIYVLRGRSWFIPAFIVLISITQATAGIVVAVNAYKLQHLSLIGTEVIEQTTWLVGSALADVLITATLAWTLMKSRRGELPQSSQILSRIVRMTVETNSLTAGLAVVALIIYLGIKPYPTLVVPPTAIIGKLYTNCLVAVFNNRQLGRNQSSNNAFSASRTTGVHVQSVRLGGAGSSLQVSVQKETRDDLDLELQPTHKF